MVTKLLKNMSKWVSLMDGSIQRLCATLVLSSFLAACEGGIGAIFSAPKVTDADNDQVVIIGDSIFALSGGIQKNLESYAGETFRNYSISGAQLVGGFLATPVPDQLREAIDDNADIDTLIMDAGGNDILIPAIFFDPYRCKTRWYQFGKLSKSCRNFIDNLYVEGVNFLNEFSQHNFKNIIFLGYYYTKNGVLGNLSTLEEASDYGAVIMNRTCDFSPVPCHFIDSRQTIVDSDIIFDGIHPNSSGSKKLADLIWPKLKPLL